MYQNMHLISNGIMRLSKQWKTSKKIYNFTDRKVKLKQTFSIKFSKYFL